MALPICDCTNTTLSAIPANTCNNSIGFIKKWVFQLQGTNFDGSASPATSSILDSASWTAVLTATDATKAVVTRKFTSAMIPASTAQTEDADGSTLVAYEKNVLVPSVYRGLSESEISAIKALACFGDLCVYGITENGRILAHYVSADVYTGIPIIDYTFRLSSPEITGGFDKSTLNFEFDSTWRENARLVTPNFNPLTFIVPA